MLARYRAYLEERYLPATARTYYTRLCFLLEGQYFIEKFKDVDIQKVLEQLSSVKHKNYFSQCKNALRHFCEFENVKPEVQHLKKIKELEHSTRKKYRKLKVIHYQETYSKINGLKNLKLKLSFLTMLKTGLRVSELTQLTPYHCSLSGDDITFNFIAKGGQKEQVTISKDDNPNFFSLLLNHIQKMSENEYLFYSSAYLQTKAKEFGFKCHDLRRIYAQLEYKKTKSIKYVMKKLRHNSIKNTAIYLRCKVDFGR